MKIILIIGAGSFLGGAGRYLLSQFMQANFSGVFPYGTLSVNVIGCFLIGVVFGVSSRGNFNPTWQLFLATGILGGFTTFSAFSLEVLNLFRGGDFWVGVWYLVSSIFLGLGATLIGIVVMK
jgi:fluoride exporter